MEISAAEIRQTYDHHNGISYTCTDGICTLKYAPVAYSAEEVNPLRAKFFGGI